MKKSHNLTRVCLLAIAVMTLMGATTQAQARNKRLVLTDGSYQPVSQYELKGDRVRYLSAERHEWEEVPASMVDWAATERFNSGQQSEAEAKDKEIEEAEKKEEESTSPLVAPGIKLPAEGGVFLLDQFQKTPDLVEMTQNGGEINRQKGKNILRSVINPLPTGITQSIELKGGRAGLQAHTGQLLLFVNVEYGDDGQSGAGEKISYIAKDQRYKIIRLQKKGERRVAANIKIGFTGKMNEKRDVVGARVEQFTSDWIRVVPDTPLAPGEYALVEMMTPEQMNLFVWDFGVDPNAPENKGGWRPTAPKSSAPGSTETPELVKKVK
ncbi:MAG: hypothetical protein HYX26_06165 [Acidobacteriales bacterium]|nr:hypothetical protein [Terriglobales bacterium]